MSDLLESTPDEPSSPLKMIEHRANGLTDWLRDNAPYCAADQYHLDEGKPERAYWHYGYMVACKDILRLLRRGVEDTTHRVHPPVELIEEQFALVRAEMARLRAALEWIAEDFGDFPAEPGNTVSWGRLWRSMAHEQRDHARSALSDGSLLATTEQPNNVNGRNQ